MIEETEPQAADGWQEVTAWRCHCWETDRWRVIMDNRYFAPERRWSVQGKFSIYVHFELRSWDDCKTSIALFEQAQALK